MIIEKQKFIYFTKSLYPSYSFMFNMGALISQSNFRGIVKDQFAAENLKMTFPGDRVF
jgi:hypothetical protein